MPPPPSFTRQVTDVVHHKEISSPVLLNNNNNNNNNTNNNNNNNSDEDIPPPALSFVRQTTDVITVDALSSSSLSIPPPLSLTRQTTDTLPQSLPLTKQNTDVYHREDVSVKSDADTDVDDDVDDDNHSLAPSSPSLTKLEKNGICRAPVILTILGTAQDAGFPHVGCYRSCCASAWNNSILCQRNNTTATDISEKIKTNKTVSKELVTCLGVCMVSACCRGMAGGGHGRCGG